MATIVKTRRHFTEAAREAAALARQRKREYREQFPADHKLVMVVVRADEPSMAFRWQIRRFGQMEPVAESRDRFADPVDAAKFGQAVLAAMKIDPAVG